MSMISRQINPEQAGEFPPELESSIRGGGYSASSSGQQSQSTIIPMDYKGMSEEEKVESMKRAEQLEKSHDELLAMLNDDSDAK